jgi:transposase
LSFVHWGYPSDELFRLGVQQQPSQWVGIDVSKGTLDVYLRPSGEGFQVANQASGIAALVNRLQAFEIEQVIVESTGGLELDVAHALQDADLAISIINPRQGRDFAKASGGSELDLWKGFKHPSQTRND